MKRMLFSASVAAAAAFCAVGTARAGDRYGCIEIGGTGVKPTLVELEFGATPPRVTFPKTKLKNREVSLSVVSRDSGFSSDAMDAAAEAVRDLAQGLIVEGVKSERISVVHSSYFRADAPNFAELRSRVEKASERKLQGIDDKAEVQLVAEALIPKIRRPDVIIVDIGSGSARLGVPTTAGDYRVASVDGVKTLATTAQATARSSNQPFADVISRQTKERVVPALAAGRSFIDASRSEFVLAIGGIAYAMTAMVIPEAAKKTVVEFTIDDVTKFRDLVRNSPPGKYPEPDLSKVSDPDVQKAATEDFDRIKGARGKEGIFTRDQLIAGAELLSTMLEHAAKSGRRLYFERDTSNAWSAAFVTPSNLRDQLPACFAKGEQAPPAGHPLTSPIPHDVARPKPSISEIPLEGSNIGDSPQTQQLADPWPNISSPPPRLALREWSYAICDEPHFSSPYLIPPGAFFHRQWMFEPGIPGYWSLPSP